MTAKRANPKEKATRAKKAEKLRAEEIPPKRVNARYVGETNDQADRNVDRTRRN